MAKRRNRPSSDEEEAAPASAADRRRERKRQRAAREAGNTRAGGGSSSWLRRGVLVGIPSAIVVVIVVLLLFNPFQPPCIQFTPVPASSGGYPQFPSHAANTSLGTSWCPPSVTNVYESYPTLRIVIGSTSVALPTGIGWNSSYRDSGAPYRCVLPISTQPASQGGVPGTIFIVSPWAYTYTLGDFFHVWSQSYSTVAVNSSFANQPINYTSTSLLGFTADASHSVTLWVDNAVSSAGPNLDISTLSGPAPPGANVYPSCLTSIYGASHSILLTYTAVRVAVGALEHPAPTLATAAPPADLAQPLGGGAGAPLAGTAIANGRLTYFLEKGLGWLALRSEA